MKLGKAKYYVLQYVNVDSFFNYLNSTCVQITQAE